MKDFFSCKLLLASLAIAASTMHDPAIAQANSQAVFAGGCFWCVEADFDKLTGVTDTQSGYAGGTTPDPTYKTYDRGGHYEVVRVIYDSSVISYASLIEYFWRTVDPTDSGGQFCDRGKSYSTAIFVANKEEKNIALSSRLALQKSGVLPAPPSTPVLQLDRFWPAEEYHQNYAKKHPWRYAYYRQGCGRDKRLKRLWRKAGDKPD